MADDLEEPTDRETAAPDAADPDEEHAPEAAATTTEGDRAEDEGDLEPATLGDLLDFIAREIVDEPDAVEVTETPDSRGVLLTLRVAPDDMGKVIGRGGRTARAIRTVVKAAAIRAGVRHTHVDIAD